MPVGCQCETKEGSVRAVIIMLTVAYPDDACSTSDGHVHSRVINGGQPAASNAYTELHKTLFNQRICSLLQQIIVVNRAVHLATQSVQLCRLTAANPRATQRDCFKEKASPLQTIQLPALVAGGLGLLGAY